MDGHKPTALSSPMSAEVDAFRKVHGDAAAFHITLDIYYQLHPGPFIVRRRLLPSDYAST